jgi:hypothetical protein
MVGRSISACKYKYVVGLEEIIVTRSIGKTPDQHRNRWKLVQ